MKLIKSILICSLALVCFTACQDKNDPDNGGGKKKGMSMSLTTRLSYTTTKPESGQKGDFSFTTEKIKLHTGLHPNTNAELPLVNVSFPSDHGKYRAAYLTYTMCSTDEGPAEWDQTTIVFIKNKATGEFTELARAITPYGGKTGSGFDASWSRSYYMDITELLPLMEGDTQIAV